MDEISVACLDVFFLKGRLGNMAIGHDRASVVDKKARPRHPRAVFADLFEIEGDILQISIFVQAGKVQEFIVRQADAIIKLIENQHYSAFGFCKKFGLCLFAGTGGEEQ